MKKPLQDQIALVTGAGRGIGRAIANELAAAGARVVLSARSRDELDKAASAIEAAGGRAESIPTDVSLEDDVRTLFSMIDSKIGPLDILINNAGIGRFAPLHKCRVEDLDEILNVNVRGTFLCTREALERMIPRRRGAVINISSVAGFKGYPDQSLYGASKHAVMGLTRALTIEAQAHGIRVSAVLPGGVDTDLIGSARPDLDRSILLRPEDVARTVLFLLTLPENAAIDEIYIRRRTSRPG